MKPGRVLTLSKYFNYYYLITITYIIIIIIIIIIITNNLHNFWFVKMKFWVYFYIFNPEVMKTGSGNQTSCRTFHNFSCLTNISLFTVLFTADVGFFFSFCCFLVRDLCRSGCRHDYHPPPSHPAPPLCFCPYQQFSL